MDYKTLAHNAVEAKANALPPYSNFHVGAAILTADNKVYTLSLIHISEPTRPY